MRSEALGLLQTMSRLETAIYTQFWYEILEQFDKTNRELQSSQMNLITAVNMWKSLKSLVEFKRNEFETSETAGKKLSGTQEYESVRTRSKNVQLQPLDYGKASAVQLTPAEKFPTEAFLQSYRSVENVTGTKIICL